MIDWLIDWLIMGVCRIFSLYLTICIPCIVCSRSVRYILGMALVTITLNKWDWSITIVMHCMTESTIECVNILLNRCIVTLVHTFVNYQQCFYPHEWLSINHYFPLCLNLSNWFQGTHLFYKSHWLCVLVALNMEHIMEHSWTEMFLLFILSL